MYYKTTFVDWDSFDEGDIENGPPSNGVVQTFDIVCRAESESEAKILLDVFVVALDIDDEVDVIEPATIDEYDRFLGNIADIRW